MTDVRHPRARSRITNNVRESLVGVDGRTERARRYRDLLEGLIVDDRCNAAAGALVEAATGRKPMRIHPRMVELA